MSVDSSTWPGLRFSRRPRSSSPGNNRAIDQLSTITQMCVELVICVLDGRDIPGRIGQLEDAAAGWAREGIPIDTIHHAIHEGVKIGYDLMITSGTASGVVAGIGDADHRPLVLTGTEFSDLRACSTALLEILAAMTTAVSGAYLGELGNVASEHHDASHVLVSALLGGHPAAAVADECGIEIASHYHVVALHIPSDSDELDSRVDSAVIAARRLRLLKSALADDNRSLLSTYGGTLLVPSTGTGGQDLDSLIARLSHVTGVPITAATTTTRTAAIPAAAEEAHQLLDTVTRLGSRPGLYRFEDLPLEFQLTRPGPALDYLGTLLAPLDPYPELLDTLRTHIASSLYRQRTARVLHVHANTVDYRLKRIAQLTGVDPTRPDGMWYMHSALIARAYYNNTGSNPEIGPERAPNLAEVRQRT